MNLFEKGGSLMTKKNIKPIESGNAKFTNEVCLAGPSIVMIRYEALAEFYAEEPIFIHAKISEDAEKIHCEQVFRVRKWSNDKLESLIIYSDNREWLNNDVVSNLIIRTVTWDKNFDKQSSLLNPNERLRHLTDWPTLQIMNHCITPYQAKEIIVNNLLPIDSLVQKGILLEKQERNSVSWNDYEFMRLFDWGQVKSTWSSDKINKKLVEKLELLFQNINRLMICPEVFQLDMDYSIPPDLFKMLLNGSYKLS